MREYEKMLGGQVYNPANLLLQVKQTIARTLCEKFNRIEENVEDKKEGKKRKTIKKLFGNCANTVNIRAPFMCDFGKNIFVNENVNIEENCVFLDTSRIDIGKNVSIGHNSCLACVSHLIYPANRKVVRNYSKPIVIEDNVTIGSNVTILGGVTISKGSKIPDGAIVTKNVQNDENETYIINNVLDKINGSYIGNILSLNEINSIAVKLNKIHSFRYIKRYFLYKKLFKRSNISTLVMAPFNCSEGQNIFLKGKAFFNYNCKVIDKENIEIGDNILVGPGTCITSETYESWLEIDDEKSKVYRPINIGENVWIGANVTIFGGVTIGNNSVIGAGAVVTQDILDGVIAYGVPCAVKKRI